MNRYLTRRTALATLGGAAAQLLLPAGRLATAAEPPLAKSIPSTGEPLPAIGLGTWITFNVGDDPRLRAQRREILRAFFAAGGSIVDSSPMYGSSEAVIGHGLAQLPAQPGLFAATKVWTPLAWLGVPQMETSERLWGVKGFDLMQVHNLLAWESHLETLTAWKAEGRIRYLGVTTSHGSRHEELEKIMRSRSLDFVQLTYNIVDREAEARLLPLAAERSIAVIANRPFRRGALFDRFAERPLPPSAQAAGAATWAAFFLKFIVSHPAVTCAIPATSRLDHLEENMAAARGPLPDAALRRRMAEEVAGL